MDKSNQVIVMYLLSHIGLIFFMYPADLIESLSVGHWSAVLLGYICHVALIAIFTKGLSYFPAQNLIDIFRGVGKGFAVVLLFPVAIYLLMVLIISIRAYPEIVTDIFLSATPLWTIMFLFLAVSAMISAFGVETLFRTGLLAAALFFPFLLLVFISSFQNADWRYAFPLMDGKTASLSYVFSRPYLESLFAFAGGFIFLGFIPSHIPYKSRKVLWASLLLLPLFLISVYVPLLTFGESTASQFPFPFIMAVDTVEISWLMFDRVTMFFMISLICFALLFISLAMWKMILLMKSVFPFIQPAYANVLLAVMLFLVCLLIPDWTTVERLLEWNTFLRLYVILVIPLVTLVLGIRQQRKGAARQ